MSAVRQAARSPLSWLVSGVSAWSALQYTAWEEQRDEGIFPGIEGAPVFLEDDE